MATYQLRPFDLATTRTALNRLQYTDDIDVPEQAGDVAGTREHIDSALHESSTSSTTAYADGTPDEWTETIESDPAADVDLDADEVAVIRFALRDYLDHCPPGQSIMGNNDLTRHMIQHALDALDGDGEQEAA